MKLKPSNVIRIAITEYIMNINTCWNAIKVKISIIYSMTSNILTFLGLTPGLLSVIREK
jgi:hypothetical protein